MAIDFGKQPISNRFLSLSSSSELTYSFQLGYCEACSLVQLINPPLSEDLKPSFSWITYNEPENHLDSLVDELIKLPGITADSHFLGVSHFEESTLVRLRKKGFENVSRLKNMLDENIDNTLSVIETIQQYLTAPDFFKNPKPKVIIVRDILEHAHDPLLLMQALSAMVEKEGYVVFEVPDYTKTFSLCDYSTLWEEHISYFSPYTFLKSLVMGGFSVHTFRKYSYDVQDYLVAVVCLGGNDKNFHSINHKVFQQEKENIDHYAVSYPKRCAWYQDVLSKYRQKGKIALLGAGHLACHFINLMKVGHLIDFLIDDHPNKCGMYMPGSKLPILSSMALEEQAPKLCLLSLSEESEKKVIANKKLFLDQGGEFASIFLTSRHTLKDCVHEF